MKLNDCFERTKEFNIPIYGDIKFRGSCNKEDEKINVLSNKDSE